MNLETIRSYRICGKFAIFDIVTAIFGLCIIFIMARNYYFPELNCINFIIAGILLAIPLGIVFHIVFGINTSLNYILGLSNKVNN
jgi:hypothetical protein